MSEITVRRLARPDLDGGFLESLDSLRSTRGLDTVRAAQIFDTINSNPDHRVFVAERNQKIVGAATLLIERKFIHNGGLVGHIEDVAVRADEQRTGVGTTLVRALTSDAKRAGCYKVTLECADDLVSYYERLGLRRHSVGLRQDLD